MDQREVLIRSGTVEDAQAIVRLLGELGYSLDVAGVRRNIESWGQRDDDLVLVAELDSSIVGVLAFHITPLFHVVGNLGRIVALVVTSKTRRQGVGARLVAFAENFAQSKDCSRIELTSGEYRLEAHQFYEKLDYKIEGKRFVKRFTTG